MTTSPATWSQAPHGRAPAVATGVKRARPDNVVFTYQGDGDLAAIGTAETVHAATRGENITVIFINNAIYGMTGGQMAPTIPAGAGHPDHPLRPRYQAPPATPSQVCEMLSTLDGAGLLPSGSPSTSVKNVNIARKAIKKAFQNQIEGKGYLHCRSALHLPHQLGHVPCGGPQVAQRQHDSLLPPGRV